MTWRHRFTVVFALVALVIGLLAPAALSAPTGDHAESDLYADLYPLYRNVDGLPLLDARGCEQPVSYRSPPAAFTGWTFTNPVDGARVWLVPLVGAAGLADGTQCDVSTSPFDYTPYLNEIEFGRLNVGRSPENVLENQLAEAMAVLSAGSTITLDHAGRIEVDGVAFDSPLVNLALHAKILETGGLAGVTLPTPSAGYGPMHHAAAWLGAAADKTWTIDPQLVVYNLAVLGLPDITTYMPTITGNGSTGVAGVSYMDFGGFTYDREATFPGCVAGYVYNADASTLTFFHDRIVDRILGGRQLVASNVHGFAHLADDALSVGAFVHDMMVVAIDPMGEDAWCDKVPPLLEVLPEEHVPGHNLGLVDPSQGRWHLRNQKGDVTVFYYGNPGDYPFVGDWDGDGVATPGLYRQSDGYVYLRNSNTQGIADIKFFFGNPGDVPIAGDWDGDGFDTVSIYRPSLGRFYIIDELGSNDGGLGAADFSFTFGDPYETPITGDWDGDGRDEVGLYRDGQVFYRTILGGGMADGSFYAGDPGDLPITGDWGTVDGVDSLGLFRPAFNQFFLWNELEGGIADMRVDGLGDSTWLPVAGPFGLD